MMGVLVGREDEKAMLLDLLASDEPQLVAIYGRRRVGKTYLVRQVLASRMAFELSGIHHATQRRQLENFSHALSDVSGTFPPAVPDSWLQAFGWLKDYLAPLVKKGKKAIFFDEFPWLSTARSGFMQAFEHFWNTWASRQPNLTVVICGSAAAWMIKKVVNGRGGLHNRVTKKIRLLPFTLQETEAFLVSRKIRLDRYQILQLYMVMGGIPHYLKEIDRGESAVQAIDRICFGKDGLLRDEFANLYRSLFDKADDHVSVVRALAKKSAGLTRNEIIRTCKLSSGGGTTQLLAELSESGFITPYIPFDRTAKDAVYKLADEYSLFYSRFMSGGKAAGKGTWVKFSAGAAWKGWCGYAFESICLKHTPQLKKALGIESVYTEESVWRHVPGADARGAQIDLLIDRRDRCVNVCEIKFSEGGFELTKAYVRELENKLRVFAETTRTRKTLFLTLVTTHGIKNMGQYTGFVQNEITMEALFA